MAAKVSVGCFALASEGLERAPSKSTRNTTSVEMEPYVTHLAASPLNICPAQFTPGNFCRGRSCDKGVHVWHVEDEAVESGGDLVE